MTPLDAFFSRLTPMVIGCSQPAMEQALVDACIEFCEETRIVNRTSGQLDCKAGVTDYPLDLPRESTTVALLEVFYGSRELELIEPDEFVMPLEIFSSDGVNTAPTGDPRRAALLDPDVIRVFPVPDKTEAKKFTVRAATKPKRNATQVENILFQNWAEPITAGAAARLHATPNQPYTSLADEQRARALFQKGINRASVEAIRGRVKGSQSIQMRPFHVGGHRWL
jgi:hypothetical protein